MAIIILSTFTALFATFLTILLIQIIRYNRHYSNLRLPPGPPGWPIVGNIFHFVLAKKPFMHYIKDVHKVYGPIITLRMGVKTHIVISSAKLAHEALIEKGQQFANRPAESYAKNIFSCGKFTVNGSNYGPQWRSLRRNLVFTMLNATRLKELGPMRTRAMDRFIERIRSDAAASQDGQSVLVLRNARFAFFCILLEMTFGLLDLDDKDILHIDRLMKQVVVFVTADIYDYLPFLRPLLFRYKAKVHAVRKRQLEIVLPLINRRRAILSDRSMHPNAAPFSYLDSLLDLKVEGRDTPPTDKELVTLCSELINGGTDTTSTAVEWAMARVIESPSIQARLYEEILAQVGQSKPVDEKDIESMPFLQAFVKEVLRIHPPTYLSLTHAAVQPGSTLAGYDIPTDAILEISLSTISEDPSIWVQPDKFDPERFLSGRETADMTGSNGMSMIPFGAGRRICPGMAMGITHIALLVARMVQEFEWSNHPSQPPLDFKHKVHFTVIMNTPLLAMVKPRKCLF